MNGTTLPIPTERRHRWTGLAAATARLIVITAMLAGCADEPADPASTAPPAYEASEIVPESSVENAAEPDTGSKGFEPPDEEASPVAAEPEAELPTAGMAPDIAPAPDREYPAAPGRRPESAPEYAESSAPWDLMPEEMEAIEMAPKPVADRGYRVVPVHYATDRKATGSTEPADWFAGDRGELSFGLCRVSIPARHRVGELESPAWWRLEFRKNPARHVVLMSIEPYDDARFFDRLRAHIQAAPKKNAFVFVHGYNVTFEDAARRTAQIAYDIGFQGAPILYSWPSQGTFQGYPVDETQAAWTEATLKDFLSAVVERTDAEELYLVAHSMGNRPLTKAFMALAASRPDLSRKVREVILTAPDIDADIFRRDIAPALVDSGVRLTLYASADDKALTASKEFHGYPRAGDAGEKIVIVPGLDTVDATGVDTSFLGHSYFAEVRTVLTDILELIRDGKRAHQRQHLLKSVQSDHGAYWVFK